MTTYYHIQRNNDGKPKPPHSLVLKPQTPRHPAVDRNDDVIEDDFTSRVSLGATIDDCVNGIDDTNRYYDLYETVGNVDTVSPTDSGPSSPGNPYGPDFRFDRWLAWVIKKNPDVDFGIVNSPAGLPDEFREEFEHCVPDVEDSNELWSLAPVKVNYLGVYDASYGVVIAEPDTHSQKAARIRSLASLLDSIASRF